MPAICEGNDEYAVRSVDRWGEDGTHSDKLFLWGWYEVDVSFNKDRFGVGVR